MEATKRPWKVEGAAIISAAGDVMALATGDEAQALIVKAVNCHEELVKALRDTRTAMCAHCRVETKCKSGPTACHAFNVATALLSKAEA